MLLAVCEVEIPTPTLYALLCWAVAIARAGEVKISSLAKEVKVHVQLVCVCVNKRA